MHATRIEPSHLHDRPKNGENWNCYERKTTSFPSPRTSATGQLATRLDIPVRAAVRFNQRSLERTWLCLRLCEVRCSWRNTKVLAAFGSPCALVMNSGGLDFATGFNVGFFHQKKLYKDNTSPVSLRSSSKIPRFFNTGSAEEKESLHLTWMSSARW